MPVSLVPSQQRSARRQELPQQPARSRTLLWSAYGLLGLLLLAYCISLIVRSVGSYSPWLDGFLVCSVEVVACALCFGRALTYRQGRSVALVLGVALLCWTVGDIVLNIESLGGVTPASPSLADAFYLGFYPFCYVAVMLFMRRELRKHAAPNWLDGAIAGVGAAAVCAAFAFHSIQVATGGSPMATMTSLAYPIGDLLLLGLVVGGTALLSGRGRRPWILLASGIGLNVVGDTFNLFSNSIGSSHIGVVFNGIAWPTAIVVMSSAVWLHQRPSNPLAPQKSAGFLLPELGAAAALVILFIGTLRSVGGVAIGLATATLLMVGIRLVLSVRGLQKLSQERHRQSVTDDLTGLGNRRHLFRVLDSFFADGAAAPDRHLAFLFVDLNHFKEINDSFGHPAGDQLLKQLGERLMTSLRNSDLLVRLGGDEFAVVLIDGDSDYAATVAERLTESLQEPFVLDVVSARISASIGIAMAPTDATDSAALVWCADVAMYRAKSGNSAFAIYEQDLDEDGDQMRLLEELRTAIDRGDLVLHYQPQLDLRTGEILAVEALVRWQHPRLGMLPPIKFLPLAEEAGLMRQLTKWVLHEAVTQCAAWRTEGRKMVVSVNVSPTNLLEPGFTDIVRDQLQRHNIPAGALVLEITETCMISEFERSRQVIEDLRDLGVIVSIDDFGAGVTSLAYLSSLAVGELKLDRSFIVGLAAGGFRDLDLVRSTIELGHAMGLRIVAEGIEDGDTLRLLTDLGCDVAQGYCISRPKPADELAFRSEGDSAAELSATAEPEAARV
jgi:diguanylate cyclase